jgi:hypothetical protein
MAGIEKYRDVGALRLLAEFEQPLGPTCPAISG